jgi:hypothetical protein
LQFADLPIEIRQVLWKDRRALRQIEHILLTLCSFGLVVVAKNDDAVQFPTAASVDVHLPRDVDKSLAGVLLRRATWGIARYEHVTTPIRDRHSPDLPIPPVLLLFRLDYGSHDRTLQ